MMNLITRLVRDEEGQGLAEYALILALVAIAAIGVLMYLRRGIENTLGDVAKNLGGDEP